MTAIGFRALCALVVCVYSGISLAADVTPDSEYGRRIKAAQSIQPAGETPFGEIINLYTGDLAFRQVDLTAVGNGPAISLVRNTVSRLWDTELNSPYPFGN